MAAGRLSDKHSDSYLGYSIIRARRGLATVGRTLVSPASVDPRLRNSEGFSSRIRTVVFEETNLFGVKLQAHGVPFMQQDGALTTCAHVTAWMAHYSAVLLELAPRVPIARLRDTSRHAGAEFGRQYPSRGLADVQILRALAEGGLAPEIVYLRDLADTRNPQWYDRDTVWKHGEAAHPWQRENITSTVSRYLNSGLPVILARGTHVQLICGYIRASDLELDDPNSDPGAVIAFVCHDESQGPYRIELVGPIVGEIDADDTLIIPLPPGLVLSGSDAELIGLRQFEEQLSNVVNIEDRLETVTGGSETLTAIRETLASLDKRKYAVRTYATFNSDFKESVRRRCSNNQIVTEAVSLARLPRFVWVTEIIDRALRSQRKPPVIGEVVIDATATSDKDAPVVIVHVPGYVESRDLVTGRFDGSTCDVEAHDSGRWAQNRQVLWWNSTGSRSKSVRAAP